MRLQVHVYPAHSGPTSKATCSFLEVASPNLSLEDLSISICQRYRRLYPHHPELRIHKIQDHDCNDLDLSYQVSDVFLDKSESKDGSVVRVIQASNLRESSIPPESALRSRSWFARGGGSNRLGTLIEGSVVAGFEQPPQPPSNKRRKIRGVDAAVVDDSLDERDGAASVADGERWLGGEEEEEQQQGEEETSFQRISSPELGVEEPAAVRPSVEITGATQLSEQAAEETEPEVKEEVTSSPVFTRSVPSSQHSSAPRPRYIPSPARESTQRSARNTPASKPNGVTKKRKDIFDFPSSDDDEATPRPRRPARKGVNGIRPAENIVPESPSTQLESEFSRSSRSIGETASQGSELRRLAAQKAEEERLEKERIEKEQAQAKAAAEREEQERREKEAAEARQKAAKAAEEREKAERERRERAEQERLAKEEEERLQKEKAEEERLAKEKEEQERLAKEKAEQERLAKEKAEQERLAKEKAEQERLAKEKEEQERLAKEKAEQERLAKEKAEQERLAKEKEKQELLEKKKKEEEARRKAKDEKKAQKDAAEAKKAAAQEKKEKARIAKEQKAEAAKKAKEQKKELKEAEQKAKETKSAKESEAVKAAATKKRPRNSDVATNSQTSPVVNKKAKTGKESQAKTATPSVEPDMGPPPAPNSSVKRNNVKAGASSQEPADGKKNSVSFADDTPSSQLQDETPTPAPRLPAVKRTPIVCPLPTQSAPSTTPAKTTTPIPVPGKGKKPAATTKATKPPSETSSESGSEETGSEPGSEEESDEETVPKTAALAMEAFSEGKLAKKPASKVAAQNAAAPKSSTNTPAPAPAPVAADSDVEMADAPMSPVSPPKPSPKKAAPAKKPAAAAKKPAPVAATKKSSPVPSSSQSAPFVVSSESGSEDDDFNPPSTQPSSKSSRPTSTQPKAKPESDESGSETGSEEESVSEKSGSESEDEDEEDTSAKDAASALNSLFSKKTPIRPNLLASNSPNTVQAASKLSSLENLDGKMEFDVREPLPPSSSQLAAARASQQQHPTPKKPAAKDSDEESSESESESEDSSSDSDSDDGGKKKAGGGIPEHKKAGSAPNKRKSKGAMGFRSIFSQKVG